MTTNQNPRSTVLLVAQDEKGKVLERHELSYEAYYEEILEVVDSDKYRADRGIRHLKGEIYDSTGSLQQAFDNRYSEDGQYVGCHAVYADGTVVDE